MLSKVNDITIRKRRYLIDSCSRFITCTSVDPSESLNPLENAIACASVIGTLSENALLNAAT